MLVELTVSYSLTQYRMAFPRPHSTPYTAFRNVPQDCVPSPEAAIMVTFLTWVPLQLNNNLNPETVTPTRPLGTLSCGDTPLFHNPPV